MIALGQLAALVDDTCSSGTTFSRNVQFSMLKVVATSAITRITAYLPKRCLMVEAVVEEAAAEVTIHIHCDRIKG